LGGEELQNGLEKFRVVRVGHVWDLGWMGLVTPPTRDHAGPPFATARRAPLRGRFARLAPPPPEGSMRSRTSTFTEHDLHPRPGRSTPNRIVTRSDAPVSTGA
jgi:hypothetical protein